MSFFRPALFLVSFSMLLHVVPQTAAAGADLLSTLTVVPRPASIEAAEGSFLLSRDLTLTLEGAAATDPRIGRAARGLLRAWESRTGLTFARDADGAYPRSNDNSRASRGLIVRCSLASDPGAPPRLGEDESYRLQITENQVILEAATWRGALHGTSTLRQLLELHDGQWRIPAMSIVDQPRFPWRGLLLDSARHFMPVDTIKRQLDGMALVKLNVLHFHLSDDQGFRVESRRFPRLQQAASEGQFYTQEQIRDLVAYAAERGIRVVPEFDVPGHAGSLLTAYPELGSQPGPYHLIEGWGIFSPALDPTNEEVYDFLQGLFSEMAGLFPDEYFHIGGDELDGKHWSASPNIQEFIRQHGLKDNAGLHAWFNQRIQKIVTGLDRKMLGWDEILHPDLPPGAIVHAWQGPARLAAALKSNHRAVVSAGYYLDLIQPAREHYLRDPLQTGEPFSPEEQKLLLGGEACMWSEWISPETIDSRLWPRAGAVAERFWSKAEVRDVPDLYRRLDSLSLRLEEAGFTHEKNRDSLLRRIAGEHATRAQVAQLDLLADLMEPVKGYQRGTFQPEFTRHSPLDGWVDLCRPESLTAWRFAQRLEAIARDPEAVSAADLAKLRSELEEWRATAREISPQLGELSPRLLEIKPLLSQLESACDLGLTWLAKREHRQTATREDADQALATLTGLAAPHAAVEVPVISALRHLVAASLPPSRAGAESVLPPRAP